MPDEGELLPEDLQGYFFNSIYNQEIVFVGSHNQNFQLKAYLCGLQQELLERTGIRTLIGIGAPGQSPEGAHLSYLQAIRAAEHLRVRNQYSVLVFDEIEVQQTSAVSYFAEQLQSLELFILKNDVFAVESVMERIIEYIRHDGTPPHMVRAVYLNTVIVIFRIAAFPAGRSKLAAIDQRFLPPSIHNRADDRYHAGKLL